jgi:hypothetical protein
MRIAQPYRDDVLLAAIERLENKIDALTWALMPSAKSRDWLSTTEAATLALRSEQTISGWCRHHRIGIQVRNRWQVDKQQLKALLIERYGAARLPPGLRTCA